MTINDTPQPPERPEDEGIPDHADDASTAFDESDRPRFDDSPSALPADRPVALDDFGLTAREQREGEPLEDRLAREEPELGQRAAGGPVLGTGQESEPARPADEPAPEALDRAEDTDPVRRRAGLSAEEAAMRTRPDDEVPYRD